MDDNFKPYVLLVEDSKMASRMACAMLTDAGLRVELAETGEEAIALVKNNPKKFDLILMDIGLPDLDGDIATAKMKENAEAKDIPVIALTAHDEEKVKQRCLSAGIVEVLIKPLNSETLERILKTYVLK